MATQASMERNEAVARFLENQVNIYKESAEYIKAAAVRKAVIAVRALTAPFAVAQELLALDGVGPGTKEKIHAFCLEYGKDPSGGITGAAEKAATAMGKDKEYEWVEASDRDVIVELIKTGELLLKHVLPWRSDISAADVA